MPNPRKRRRARAVSTSELRWVAAIATGPHDGFADETSVAWLRWRYRWWATWAENSKMAPQASVGPTAIVPPSRRWNGTP